jgi:ribosomal-protein-alanine N-acetyltransferase
MRKEDIAQITEIDHEAFPTMWPPANYERELNTPLAHYIVVHEGSLTIEETGGTGKPPPADEQYIVGFAGIWMMADEAHLTNIAVRRSHRRRGIGELLLISIINLALELDARILTLEVRASNISAQSLYHKYGFSQINIRQGYYTDNKESALVMAIEDITSAAFQERLNQLKEVYHSR